METQLQAVSQSVQLLAHATLSQTDIDQFWTGPVLSQAVTTLIHRLCFEGPTKTQHKACEEFWLSLPLEDRSTQFYCLGPQLVCVNCGVEITALVQVDEKGDLIKGACPHCHEPIEGLGLEQHTWWDALVTTAAEMVARFSSVTGQLITGLIYKMAEFRVRAGLVTFVPESVDSREHARTELYHWLWDQFSESQRSVCSQAATWAIWGTFGMQALGFTNGTLSTYTKRSLTTVVHLAGTKTLRGDDLSEIREELAEVWKSDIDLQEKLNRLMRLLVEGTLEEEQAPRQRLAAVELINPNDPDSDCYLVVRGAHADILSLYDGVSIIEIDDEVMRSLFRADFDTTAPLSWMLEDLFPRSLDSTE
jgi:hypothetical protein